MIKQLNEIIHLLESIHGTECDVEIDLDGSLTFKITQTKINEVRIPEDSILHGDIKLRTVDDDFDDFIRSKSGRV